MQREFSFFFFFLTHPQTIEPAEHVAEQRTQLLQVRIGTHTFKWQKETARRFGSNPSGRGD